MQKEIIFEDLLIIIFMKQSAIQDFKTVLLILGNKIKYTKKLTLKYDGGISIQQFDISLQKKMFLSSSMKLSNTKGGSGF